jgi:hypothetical protein
MNDRATKLFTVTSANVDSDRAPLVPRIETESVFSQLLQDVSMGWFEAPGAAR